MKEKVSSTDFENSSCDKYDYLMAAFCGGVAGVIDILFVGTPGKSLLGNFSDNAADGIVKKFATLSGRKIMLRQPLVFWKEIFL